jgi:hypothetical protein
MLVPPVLARIPTYLVVTLAMTSLSPPDAVRFPSLIEVALVAVLTGFCVFWSVIRVMQSRDGFKGE